MILTKSIIIVHEDRVKLKFYASIFENDKNFLVIGAYSNFKIGLQEIVNKNINVLLLSNSIEDNVEPLISSIMEQKPVPILLLNEQKDAVYTNYGIITIFYPKWKDNTLLNKSKFLIQINILAKLNIRKFMSQIKSLNNIISNFESGENTVKLNNIQKLENMGSKTNRIHDSTRINNIRNSKLIRGVSPVVANNKIVVIGASTGGPRVLTYILSRIPKNFPPILVVQHIPKGFVQNFANRINEYTNLEVVKGNMGTKIKSGMVYIAPGDYHMEVQLKNGELELVTNKAPKVNYVRPSVDVTIKSVVKHYKQNTLCIILTGMGSDGTEGCKIVKEMGGKIVALNEEDSIIYGMNKSVIECGLADYIGGMNDIPELILEALNN